MSTSWLCKGMATCTCHECVACSCWCGCDVVSSSRMCKGMGTCTCGAVLCWCCCAGLPGVLVSPSCCGLYAHVAPPPRSSPPPCCLQWGVGLSGPIGSCIRLGLPEPCNNSCGVLGGIPEALSCRKTGCHSECQVSLEVSVMSAKILHCQHKAARVPEHGTR